MDFTTLDIQTLTIKTQSNFSPASLRRILVENNVNIAGEADILLNQVRSNTLLAQPDFKLAFVNGHNLGLSGDYRYEKVCKQGVVMWGFTLISTPHLIQILPKVKNMPSCRLVMEPIVHSRLGSMRIFSVASIENSTWLSEVETSAPAGPERLWAFVVPE